jgi:hypothetical protein
MKKQEPTERQGQFLAYIHQYSLVNGCVYLGLGFGSAQA